MSQINITQGDITTASVDVIVNAANPIMLGGGGVDGAIHKAAGAKLLEECRRVKATNGIRCPSGEARITSGCNLKAKFIIHTVGPRYKIEKTPEHCLASAYTNSLDLAVLNDCKSIAFPAISCGVYGYPIQEAAEIAISTCLKSKYKNLAISFFLYNKSTFECWIKALERLSA